MYSNILSAQVDCVTSLSINFAAHCLLFQCMLVWTEKCSLIPHVSFIGQLTRAHLSRCNNHLSISEVRLFECLQLKVLHFDADAVIQYGIFLEKATCIYFSSWDYLKRNEWFYLRLMYIPVSFTLVVSDKLNRNSFFLLLHIQPADSKVHSIWPRICTEDIWITQHMAWFGSERLLGSYLAFITERDRHRSIDLLAH